MLTRILSSVSAAMFIMFQMSVLSAPAFPGETASANRVCTATNKDVSESETGLYSFDVLPTDLNQPED